MNTNNEIDRIVVGFLEDRVAAPPRPELLRASLHRTSTTPQARRRLLERWLDRDEGVGRHAADRDHVPKTNRRSTFMFTTAAVTAAIAIVTVSLQVITPSPVPAETVALQSDSGTSYHRSISEAVAAAEDGDQLRIGPGVYVESIVIDKDIILSGDADPDRVVLVAPEDGPRTSVLSVDSVTGVNEPDPTDLLVPYSLLLLDSDAIVSDFSVLGRHSTVIVQGGEPTISGLRFTDVGWPWTGSGDEWDSIALGAGTRARVEANTLSGGGSISGKLGTAARIEGNTLTDGPDISGEFGPDTVIRGNTVRDPGMYGITIFDGGGGLLERNTITSAPIGAIQVGWYDGSEIEATVRDNVVDGAYVGIDLIAGAQADVTGNAVTGTSIGLLLQGSDSVVSDNELHGNPVGIAIRSGTPTLSDNSVVNSVTGLTIDAGALPLLLGNDICGSDTSIQLTGNAAMPDVAGNDIC